MFVSSVKALILLVSSSIISIRLSEIIDKIIVNNVSRVRVYTVFFRFQICERKSDNEFLFRFQTANENRIPFSFSNLRTKNEFFFCFHK